MSLLITGGNGFIGTYLCAELFNQGKTFRVSSRDVNIASKHINYTQTGPIDGLTDWSTALKGIDVIVHLAARAHLINDKATFPLAEFRRVNVNGTLNLARQAIASGVRRFVFVSSIGVNGNQNDRAFNENDTPNPQEPYALSKFEAEQGLRELARQSGMEVVIIRPPLVYAANAPGNFSRLMTLTKRAAKFHIPLPFGAITSRRSLVAVQNLVSFIMTCIDHPSAANQTFLIADGKDFSIKELLSACAKAQGMELRLLDFPQKWLEIAATAVGKKTTVLKLCANLQVDSTKAQTTLGWTPPVTSIMQGLTMTMHK